MPSHLSNPRTLRLTAAALALAAGTTLAACTNNDGMPGMPGMSGSAPSTTATAAATHNSQDVMFAQMMIPHHQQAIEMSDILLAKDGIDPRVTKLAEQIKAAQKPEITTMRGWLSSWDENPSPSATSHDMGSDSGDDGADDGMMDPADMAALEEATGKEASRLFLSGMIKHHRGAIDMAEMEVAEGENPAAKKLAETIITTQQAEIDTMTKLAVELG